MSIYDTKIFFLASKCQTMACGCANARIPCSEFCECRESCYNKFNVNAENNDYVNGSDSESESELDDSSSEDDDIDMY